LLAEMPKNQGGGIAGSAGTSATLAQVLGAESEPQARHQSSRWQAIAGIPEEMFDELLL
jgi:hypothetical protein